MKNRSHERSPSAVAINDAPAAPETDLSLESTSSQTMRGLRAPHASSSGYNPYDTVPGATASHGNSATGMHRLDDMRRLSEWIRMKRDIDRAQGKDPGKKK